MSFNALCQMATSHCSTQAWFRRACPLLLVRCCNQACAEMRLIALACWCRRFGRPQLGSAPSGLVPPYVCVRMIPSPQRGRLHTPGLPTGDCEVQRHRRDLQLADGRRLVDQRFQHREAMQDYLGLGTPLHRAQARDGQGGLADGCLRAPPTSEGHSARRVALCLARPLRRRHEVPSGARVGKPTSSVPSG